MKTAFYSRSLLFPPPLEKFVVFKITVNYLYSNSAVCKFFIMKRSERKDVDADEFI